jgi:hypothetical protein
MANLRRRIPWQTESLFAENHEAFFNSIDPKLPIVVKRLCGTQWQQHLINAATSSRVRQSETWCHADEPGG